jgi:hypothetical protein
MEDYKRENIKMDFWRPVLSVCGGSDLFKKVLHDGRYLRLGICYQRISSVTVPSVEAQLEGLFRGTFFLDSVLF